MSDQQPVDPASHPNANPLGGASITPSAPVEPQASAPRVIDSESILLGQLEVLIAHGGEIYRLRRTRNGKLILQK